MTAEEQQAVAGHLFGKAISIGHCLGEKWHPVTIVAIDTFPGTKRDPTKDWYVFGTDGENAICMCALAVHHEDGQQQLLRKIVPINHLTECNPNLQILELSDTERSLAVQRIKRVVNKIRFDSQKVTLREPDGEATASLLEQARSQFGLGTPVTPLQSIEFDHADACNGHRYGYLIGMIDDGCIVAVPGEGGSWNLVPQLVGFDEVIGSVFAHNSQSPLYKEMLDRMNAQSRRKRENERKGAPEIQQCAWPDEATITKLQQEARDKFGDTPDFKVHEAPRKLLFRNEQSFFAHRQGIAMGSHRNGIVVAVQNEQGNWHICDEPAPFNIFSGSTM